jgi:hypothetical protein
MTYNIIINFIDNYNTNYNQRILNLVNISTYDHLNEFILYIESNNKRKCKKYIINLKISIENKINKILTPERNLLNEHFIKFTKNPLKVRYNSIFNNIHKSNKINDLERFILYIESNNKIKNKKWNAILLLGIETRINIIMTPRNIDIIHCEYCQQLFNKGNIYSCDTCNKYYCTNSVLYSRINKTDTSKYCKDCVTDEFIQLIINDNNERIQFEKLKRKNELIKLLNTYGLQLRNDSSLCKNYIEYNSNNIFDVVYRMCEMKYLFNYQNMENEIDKAHNEQLELINYGYYPDISIFEQAEFNVLNRIGNYPVLFPWLKNIIKKRNNDLHEELLANLYHPDKIMKWIQAGNPIEKIYN